MVTKFALRDAAGKPYAVCGAYTDVTARKRLEEERSRIFDLSLDMMCVTGFDGYQKVTNPQVLRRAGLERGKSSRAASSSSSCTPTTANRRKRP